MLKQTQRALPLLVSATLLALLLAACGPSAAVPEPTRTPLPTFTPTPQDQGVAQTDTTSQTQGGGQQAGGQQNGGQQGGQTVQQAPTDTPAPPPTDTPKPAPTDTPKPAPAEVVANSVINVRGGPGTNYNIIGAANQGQRFTVKAKSPDGAWWQVDFNGQDGWVFGQLVNAQNTGAVAVAQNIPQPPPPTAAPPPPPPTNTPQPAAPQPTTPPKSNYKFSKALVQKCERQPAGNWFDGTTYVDHQPTSGFKVVFSYAPDAPPITDPVLSGPHAGYPGWRAGYYSHIIHATGPQAGDWFVWVVDDAGQRISEVAHWHSTGPGDDCNQATVDFDTK